MAPQVTPAVEEKNYNQFWITNLTMNSPDPNQVTTCSVTLQKYALLNNGTKELLEGSQIQVNIADLFTEAQNDSSLAILVGGIVEYVGSVVARYNY